MIRIPGKRGRPRIKREPIADELNVTIDGIITEAENIIVANNDENQLVEEVTTGATRPALPNNKRKFPHHCDWPGCERSFRRY